MNESVTRGLHFADVICAWPLYHLYLLKVYRVTSRLGTSMCDCLRADPRSLTAAHGAVAELHEALRSAGAELRRHAPPHFPQMQVRRKFVRLRESRNLVLNFD